MNRKLRESIIINHYDGNGELHCLPSESCGKECDKEHEIGGREQGDARRTTETGVFGAVPTTVYGDMSAERQYP